MDTLSGKIGKLIEDYPKGTVAVTLLIVGAFIWFLFGGEDKKDEFDRFFVQAKVEEVLDCAVDGRSAGKCIAKIKGESTGKMTVEVTGRVAPEMLVFKACKKFSEGSWHCGGWINQLMIPDAPEYLEVEHKLMAFNKRRFY